MTTTAPSPPLAIEWEDTLERLRAFVFSRVGDRQLAEDITHDVIVRSIAAGALERVDNPIGWLVRSAANAVIDHRRTHRVHEPLAPDAGVEPDADDDVDDAATLRQLARCVQPLLGRLEAKYRDAVTMVDLDGLGHADAAAAAGVSVSGMKSRVQRGRRQLKSLLTGCCEVELDARGAPMDARPRTTCACAG